MTRMRIFEARPAATAHEFSASLAGSVAGLSYRLHSSRRARTHAASRPVFVLVHGIGMSHRYFNRLRGELLEHGDVVVFDLPGFGGTSRPERQLSVADYARVIGGALEQAHIEQCIVVGHSMGSQFVTDLALQRPDLVTAVVLIGPVTDTAHPSAARNTVALVVDTLLEKPSTNLLVSGAYLRCGIRWYLTELPVMLGYRLDDQLARVDQPVLILRGSRDVIANRTWCGRLVKVARRGLLVEIPGHPHAVHRGGYRRVGEEIVRFAGSLPPRQVASDDDPASRIRTGPRAVRHLDMRGVTAGDRQCRAYMMPYRTADRGPADAEQESQVPVFVLVHGIGMSHRYFRSLGQQLSRHGRVLLIDLPGYGWTHRPARGITNPASAELLAELLDDIGVSSCVVVGHSMGAQAATELSIQRPDLVSHLVLIGAAVDALRRTVPEQAFTLGLNSVLEKPLLNAVQFLDVIKCGPRWYVTELAVGMAYRLDERLPLARQPVLVVRGSRDLVAGSRWSRSLADLARQGRLIIVPGAQHAVHHSSSRRVAAAIADFITGDSRLPR